jgi:2-oxoglutarate ferredoxin oxidoreductase subunit gamma
METVVSAREEIRIAGFGGQGVILAGMVIGRAATIFDGKHVTLTQSFGPEARGSAASANLIVSDDPILYPYPTHLDVLVAMSEEAYTRFVPELRPHGTLLFEQDLVSLAPRRTDIETFGIPATRLAEELGRKFVLNLVMVGFLIGVTGLLAPEAVRKSIADSVPKGTEALNTAAFDKGLEFALSQKPSPVHP